MKFEQILAAIVLLLPAIAIFSIIFGLTKAYRESKYDLIGELKNENKSKSYLSRWPKTACLLTPIIIGMITPSLVIFALMYFVGGYGLLKAAQEVLIGQFKPGVNYFLGSVMATIPFVLLSIVTRAILIIKTLRASWCICLGGLIGILALMIPAHVSIWYPLYGGGHMSSTAVIGFLFIPIYCVASGAMGALIGWMITFLPWFKISNEEDSIQK